MNNIIYGVYKTTTIKTVALAPNMADMNNQLITALGGLFLEPVV